MVIPGVRPLSFSKFIVSCVVHHDSYSWLAAGWTKIDGGTSEGDVSLMGSDSCYQHGFYLSCMVHENCRLAVMCGSHSRFSTGRIIVGFSCGPILNGTEDRTIHISSTVGRNRPSPYKRNAGVLGELGSPNNMPSRKIERAILKLSLNINMYVCKTVPIMLPRHTG